MYEFEIWNKATDERILMFGYDTADTMEKAGYSIDEWTVIGRWYID